MTAHETDMPRAIVDYLRALSHPDALRDVTAIELIDDQLEKLDLDPAERLDLLLRRRSLDHIDLGPLREAFVGAVPKFLTSRGLKFADVRDDFAAVAVPSEVLQELAEVTTQPDSGRSGVAADAVRDAALALTVAFTQADVISQTGASRNTVGKVLQGLVGEGLLTEQRGRPKTYRLNSAG